MRHHCLHSIHNMASNRTFDDLDLSKDEVKRLSEALKDEKFRKMLVEYAEEISNPENRRKAEEEIAMMENERGMSVQFIYPEPGYVLKTTVDGTKKAFINICQNDKIEKPKANKQTGHDGKRGVMWQIPHSFAPPRDDNDKTHHLCKVFDVVFHPDTYRMATSNERFKKLVEDTAVDGIESQFGVKLDKKNIKRPKMKFKGIPQATVIRDRMAQNDSKDNTHVADQDDILSQMPYPYGSKTSAEKAIENQFKHTQDTNKPSKGKVKLDDSKFTVPKYTITHVSEIDISEYRNAPDARTSTCPKALVIKIELPLLNSAAQTSLDIFEKKLILESVSPAAYKLDLSLPYRVNEDDGSAKFDKSKRTLTVTLPVISPKMPTLPFSGVTGESDETFNVNGSSCPLIKDLSSSAVTNNTVGINNYSENSNQVLFDANKNVEQKNNENNDVFIDKKLTFPQNVKWVLPSHQFSQDNETVSFLINVKQIEENTVEMSFPQSFAAVIQFMSIGAGCFPIYYRLYIQFPDDCGISSEHCSVDVSTNNLVFIILKSNKCRGLWDNFSTGIDETQLEEKQFLTESNLQKELADLDKEAEEEANMPGQVEVTPLLSVVEMSEKRLTIDIKPPKSRKWKLSDKTEEEDEEDYDPASSAEIEVIHKHPLPDLHSILKLRSSSESSEETSNCDPESPRSESQELASSFSKKRSVSFSNHVDHASFKSSASVSSMTPALKSKRRRQRKREEKKKGRVRCNSEGTSSSEECLHSVSDSYSQSEEEGESSNKKAKGGRKAVLRRATSDPGPNAGEGLCTENDGEKGSGEPVKCETKKNKISDKHILGTKSNVSIANTVVDDVLDKDEDECVNCNEDKDSQGMETSIVLERQVTASGVGNFVEHSNESKEIFVVDGKSTMNKDKKICEIKSKLAEEQEDGKKNGQNEDSDDDDDFVDAISSLIEELKTSSDCNERVTVSNNLEEPCNRPNSEDKTKLIEEIDHVEADTSIRKTESTTHKDGISSTNGKDHNERDTSDVETMLSWEEGRVSAEHVTVCALQFSNSLMYDLDVE